MEWKTLVKNRTLLAPMAGYTDAGFRKLCLEYGAGAVVTEMVSAKALSLNNSHTEELLKAEEDEHPRILQLFGHEPEAFRLAVRHPFVQAFDAIDLNMGCPVPKIVRNGDGCALMDTPLVAAKIIETVKRYAQKPVSVKFRLGFAEERHNCVAFAKMCWECGADALTIHGRTRPQMYAGKARYEEIAEANAAVNVPVYANGDIRTAEYGEKVLRETGCFGIAFGRGALGNPWIFQGRNEADPEERRQALDRYVSLTRKHYGDRYLVNALKRQAPYFLKGLRGAKEAIRRIQSIADSGQMQTVLDRFFGGENEI